MAVSYAALLRIKVVADAAQASRELDKTSSSAGKFGRGIQRAAAPAAAVVGAVALIGKQAMDSASQLQQAQGAVESVFGSASKAVDKYAKTSANRMGLAESAYLQYAALVGSALQNAGFSAQESADMTDKAMSRAADMAATFGGTTAEAVEAINAAVSRGEFDPLEKYGVSLNATAVNAELAARGQDKLTGSALSQAKAQVVLDSVYKKTAKSAGQFAREQDSAAGSSQIAAANWENASATLGQVLLPVATKVAKVLADMARWMQKNSTVVLVVVGALTALAVAVLAVNAALKVYQATLVVIQVVQKATFLTNPIFLVILAIVALVAAIVILWKRSETFRRVVLAVWGAVKAGAKAAGSAIKAAFLASWNAISGAARKVGSVIKGVWNGIRSAVRLVIAVVQTLIGKIRAIKVPGAIRNAIDAIRDAVTRAIAKVVELINKIRGMSVPGAVKSAIDGIKNAADRALGVIKDIVGWLRDIPTPQINWPSPPAWLDKVIPGSFSARPAPSPVSAAGRSVAPGVPSARAGSGATALAGGGFTINVYGAIDPESTARAVRRVLDGHDRRMGRRVS